jgi:signal transduction histidine kinase
MRPKALAEQSLLSEPLKHALGCLAAIVLPWIGTNLSVETHALQGTPMALSFASVAAITLLAGFGPGILGCIVNAILFNHYVLARTTNWAIHPLDILHTSVIFLVGLLIAFFCERQRVSQLQLRLAHASLQARTASLMDAQQGSNSATWTHNVHDQWTDWAEGGAQILGRPFSEVSRLDSFIVTITLEDRPRFVQAVQHAIQTNEPFHIEFRVLWPNSEVHWLESRGTLSPVDSNIWRGVTIDITDRKNAEIALIRSEKLAAIGRLSATIAHEINNPLEAVTNLLYLASSDPSLALETRRYLQDADKEITRLANIARRTLTFVRSRPSGESANVTEVAESVASMFRPRCASRNAEIHMARIDPLQISLPSGDLWQILTNLISNACDALDSSRGIIEIRTVRENDSAVIYVSDNGSGIAPENRERVFDPFFTTKPEVGTGIGLWVTKDLVEKNGGRIGVLPVSLSPDFTTTFRIEFPLHSTTA